jgi:membrane-associated protease RseP (regulator of RpoE activity)
MSEQDAINSPSYDIQWELPDLVAGVMEISDRGYEGPFLVFRGALRLPSDQAFRIIREKTAPFGLLVFLARDKRGTALKFAPARTERKPGRPLVHLLLFLATVVSTLFVGVAFQEIGAQELMARPLLLLRGWPFSLTLLSILLCHEFSHYLVSLRHGVKSSLPYFIPFPNLFGTMGALIVSRSPFPNRKSLFDVGIAGPIASFVLSAAALFVGLSELKLAEIPPGPAAIYFGDSLLTKFIFGLRFPHLAPGQDIMIGAVSFAGWVGLMVTAINLFPIGQLDGGHIAYALFGAKHPLIARIFIAILVLLGIVFWEGWLVWVLVILLMGIRHPPPLDDVTPLDPRRRLLGWLVFLILLLSFVPAPITG